MSRLTEMMIDQVVLRCGEATKILVACANTERLNEAMDRLVIRLDEAGKDCERVGYTIVSGPTFVQFVDWFATNPPQTSNLKLISDREDQ